jgi:hypothetical protein
VILYKNKLKEYDGKFSFLRKCFHLLKTYPKNDEDYRNELPFILLKSYSNIHPYYQPKKYEKIYESLKEMSAHFKKIKLLLSQFNKPYKYYKENNER